MIYRGKVPGATRQERAKNIKAVLRQTQQAGLSNVRAKFGRSGNVVISSPQLSSPVVIPTQTKLAQLERQGISRTSIAGTKSPAVRQAIAQRLLERGQIIRKGAMKNYQNRLATQNYEVTLGSGEKYRGTQEQAERITAIINRQLAPIVEQPASFSDNQPSRFEKFLGKVERAESRSQELSTNIQKSLGVYQTEKFFDFSKAKNPMQAISAFFKQSAQALVGVAVEMVMVAPTMIGGRLNIVAMGLIDTTKSRKSVIDVIKDKQVYKDVVIGVVKAFDPRTPRGIANIILTGIAIKMLASSRQAQLKFNKEMASAKVLREKVIIKKTGKNSYAVTKEGVLKVGNKKIPYTEKSTMNLAELKRTMEVVRKGTIKFKITAKAIKNAEFISKGKIVKLSKVTAKTKVSAIEYGKIKAIAGKKGIIIKKGLVKGEYHIISKGAKAKTIMGLSKLKSYIGKLKVPKASKMGRISNYKYVQKIKTKMSNFRVKGNVLEYDSLAYMKYLTRKTIVQNLKVTAKTIIRKLPKAPAKLKAMYIKKLKVISRELGKIAKATSNKKASFSIYSDKSVIEQYTTLGHDLSSVKKILAKYDAHQTALVKALAKNKLSLKSLAGKSQVGLFAGARAVLTPKTIVFGAFAPAVKSVAEVQNAFVTQPQAQIGYDAVARAVSESEPVPTPDVITEPVPRTISRSTPSPSIITQIFTAGVASVIPAMLPFIPLPSNVGSSGGGGGYSFSSMPSKYFVYIPDLQSLLYGKRATKAEARKLTAVGRIFTGAEIRKVV